MAIGTWRTVSPGTSKVSEAPGARQYSMIVGIAVLEMSSTGRTGGPTIVLDERALALVEQPDHDLAPGAGRGVGPRVEPPCQFVTTELARVRSQTLQNVSQVSHVHLPGHACSSVDSTPSISASSSAAMFGESRPR